MIFFELILITKYQIAMEQKKSYIPFQFISLSSDQNLSAIHVMDENQMKFMKIEFNWLTQNIIDFNQIYWDEGEDKVYI
jgi:hypothetical protein